MSGYEKVKRLGVSVANEFPARVKSHALRVHASDCVLTTVNGSSQIVRFNLLDHSRAENATFHIYEVKIACFDEVLDLFRVLVLSGRDQLFDDAKTTLAAAGVWSFPLPFPPFHETPNLALLM